LVALFPILRDCIKNNQSAVLATVIRGESLGAKALILDQEPSLGPLLDQPWANDLLSDAHALLQQAGTAAIKRYAAGEVEVFLEAYLPGPRLIIVGGVHIAEPLIRYAQPLGFHTFVVDPRTAFANPERFPHADEICNQWPDDALRQIGLTRHTAVVVITHDPKLDDPALKLALPSPAFYVGALGSPTTNSQRFERLQADGVPPAELARLHAPIGLNLGGRTPAEIALSIMAEIVAVRSGSPLAKS